MSDWTPVADIVIRTVEEQLGAMDKDNPAAERIRDLGSEAADLARRAHEDPSLVPSLQVELAIVEANVRVILAMNDLKETRRWRAAAKEVVSVVRMGIAIAAAIA